MPHFFFFNLCVCVCVRGLRLYMQLGVESGRSMVNILVGFYIFCRRAGGRAGRWADPWIDGS